jgi:hypothetical protein
MPTVEREFDRAWTCCNDALGTDVMQSTARALAREGAAPASTVTFVGSVTEDRATHSALHEWKAALAARGEPTTDAEVERLLLMRAALASLPALQDAPVSHDVKRLMCEEFCFFATAPADTFAQFEVGGSRFVGMCKTASLRRFRAGLFDWEVSGVSRSDVAAVSLRHLPGTIAFLLWRMRGLGPVFFSHLNPRRTSRVFREDEGNRSYYRMAKSMELQPAIKGFAACSWFRSPGTHRVSPHLAWLSRVFREHGGVVVESGPADPDCGVFARSETRRRLYESGTFRPTRGLVLWPRDAMIAWAAAHPEWAEHSAGVTHASSAAIVNLEPSRTSLCQ